MVRELWCEPTMFQIGLQGEAQKYRCRTREFPSSMSPPQQVDNFLSAKNPKHLDAMPYGEAATLPEGVLDQNGLKWFKTTILGLTTLDFGIQNGPKLSVKRPCRGAM